MVFTECIEVKQGIINNENSKTNTISINTYGRLIKKPVHNFFNLLVMRKALG